jgi:hypothetical protein
VRRMGTTRIATAMVVAGTLLLAAGTSEAVAATHSPRTVMFTPRTLAAMAPKGGLLHRMAGLLPGASTVDLANLELFSDPVPVTVNGVTYQMTMSVENLPVAFDEPPELVIELDRTKVGGGLITGEQAHVYGYAPLSGLHFTANAGLTRATVKTGSSILPSALDVRFHATGTVDQSPCSLVGGGQGEFQAASGTISATTFKIATATTPFFGTITTVPQTATVFHDPGCANFIGFGAAAKAAREPVFHPQCTGRESISESSLTSYWVGQTGFGGNRMVQLGLTESNPFGPDGVDHEVAGLGPGADMPHPQKTAGGGVRAEVRTAGVPFMGGRAVFTSTGKAFVSPGHTCTWERHTYHYTTTRYAGRLTSATNPLAMMFDTGAATLTPAPATLYLHTYTR